MPTRVIHLDIDNAPEEHSTAQDKGALKNFLIRKLASKASIDRKLDGKAYDLNVRNHNAMNNTQGSKCKYQSSSLLQALRQQQYARDYANGSLEDIFRSPSLRESLCMQ